MGMTVSQYDNELFYYENSEKHMQLAYTEGLGIPRGASWDEVFEKAKEDYPIVESWEDTEFVLECLAEDNATAVKVGLGIAAVATSLLL